MVKFEFRGDKEMLEALVKNAKENGLNAQFDELLLNSKSSGVAYIAHIVGSVAAIAIAIASFQKQHKTSLEIKTSEGTFNEQNYTAEQLEKILPSVCTNIFVHSSTNKYSRP